MLHEDVITGKLVDELEKLRYTWKIEPQNPRTFIDGSRRPDFIVKDKGKQTVVAEVKIDRRNAPDLSVETQASEHIGRRLASYEYVTTAIAIRLPFRLRMLSNRELADELRQANDMQHVLFTQDAGENIKRFPSKGWITGGLTDIATSLHIGAIPTSRVESAASDLERGVDEAAKRLESAIEQRPQMGHDIENILYQKSCEQTSRMAMLIITNAFVFQSRLARTTDLEEVPALNQLETNRQRLNVAQILEAWHKICDVNYIPIFYVAIELVKAIASDDELVGELCLILRNTAQNLIESGLSFVHELAGIVFQRLIVNRDFIKTFYTRPVSVALLSALVLPQKDTIDADQKASLTELKIADYACGTGALLNGVYQRVLAQYEQAGGNAKDIHKSMIENNLVGCDIMPNASHLTAALIASNFPDIRIGKTHINVLEYSTTLRTGQYALGALDLLEDPQEGLPIPILNPTQVQGGADTTETYQPEFKHGEIDIVIQNPPFTRVGADNSATNPEVPTTIFGEQAPEIAEKMRKALAAIRDTLGNSSAGFSSYFVDLAHRMLKPNGKSVMGFVLPITALVSPDWEKVRDLWAENYHNIIVTTIADAKTDKCSFSADTNMAECLVVATKGKSKNTGRGTFVCLHKRPTNHLEALQIAKNIQRLNIVRKYENPPIGGNAIKVGENLIGYALNCPLKETNWAATRVKDLSLLQTAYHLRNGKIWLPQQRDPIDIPMTLVGNLAEVQYDNKRISGATGAFDVEIGGTLHDQYTGLWHVNANAQRAMKVEPDCSLMIRETQWDRAQQVLDRNSRVHHMAKLRFNANSLAVLFTDRPSIGVNTIPNVKFRNTDYDYVWTLWGNSTLGMICYWMHGNKQHSGRSQIRLMALRSMPTFDISTLDTDRLQNAKQLFEEMMYKKMLPFNQMDEDPVRHELDRRLLSEVLGFTEDTHPQIHQGIEIIRKHLCAEPSIHGGKIERVVL